MLTILVARKANNDTFNALAMILSRREEAPRALTSNIVSGIVEIAAGELVRLTEALSFKVRFKNALSAIAGLFRYREIEPFSLLASGDPVAQQLRQQLDTVDALLLKHRKRVAMCDEKRALVSLINEYLDGAGDPNVLIRIGELDESDENDDE